MNTLTTNQLPTRNPRRLSKEVEDMVNALMVKKPSSAPEVEELESFGSLDDATREMVDLAMAPADTNADPAWVDGPPAPTGNLPTNNQALAQVAANDAVDYGAGLARAGAQGASLGGADEVEAFWRSRNGGDYDQELGNIHGQMKQFSADYPKTAMAAEFAGGMAVPGGMVMKPLQMASKLKNPITRNLARVGAGATGGATMAGIYGHNTGTGEMFGDNRMQRARDAAPFGAALGAALPYAVPTVAEMVKKAMGGVKSVPKRVGDIHNMVQDAMLNTGRKMNIRKRKAMKSDHDAVMTREYLDSIMANKKAETYKSLHNQHNQQAHAQSARNLADQAMARNKNIPELEKSRLDSEIKAMIDAQLVKKPASPRSGGRSHQKSSASQPRDDALDLQDVAQRDQRQRSGGQRDAVTRQLESGGPHQKPSHQGNETQAYQTAHRSTGSGQDISPSSFPIVVPRSPSVANSGGGVKNTGKSAVRDALAMRGARKMADMDGYNPVKDPHPPEFISEVKKIARENPKITAKEFSEGFKKVHGVDIHPSTIRGWIK